MNASTVRLFHTNKSTTNAVDLQHDKTSYTKDVEAVREKTSTMPLHIAVTYMPGHKEHAERFLQRMFADAQTALPDVALQGHVLALSATAVSANVKVLTSHEFSIRSAVQLGNSFIVTPAWTDTEVTLHARETGMVQSRQLFAVHGDPRKRLFALFRDTETGTEFGGVYSPAINAQRYLETLTAVQEVKRLCVTYNRGLSSNTEQELIDRDLEALHTAAREYGIGVAVHYWDTTSANLDLLARKLDTHQAVITLNEPTVRLHQKSMSDLCRHMRRSYHASTLDEVFEGAAIGHGYAVEDYSPALITLMSDTMIDVPNAYKQKLFELAPAHEAYFNEREFAEQGIVLDAKQRELLRMRSIYDRK